MFCKCWKIQSTPAEACYNEANKTREREIVTPDDDDRNQQIARHIKIEWENFWRKEESLSIDIDNLRLIQKISKIKIRWKKNRGDKLYGEDKIRTE